MVSVKVFRVVFAILGIAGLVLSAFTVGALDLGAEIGNGIKFQIAASVVLMVCGGIGLYMTQPEE